MMNRLPSIIGPAPSEMDFPDLLRKLHAERKRVREAILVFRTSPPQGAKRKAKPKKSHVPGKRKVKRTVKKQMALNLKAMQKAGVSMEDLQKALAAAKGGASGTKDKSE